MDILDRRVLALSIEEYGAELARIAWKAGDALILLREIAGSSPGWVQEVKSMYPQQLDALSASEMKLYISAAESFTTEERGYNLPWCMYAYAVKNTDDPSGWIRKAVDSGWKYSDLRKEILATKSVKSKGTEEDRLIHTICTCSIDDPSDGSCVGVLSVYIDLSDMQAGPIASLQLVKTELTGRQVTALREKLQLCEFEMEEYLGVMSLQKEADLNSLVA